MIAPHRCCRQLFPVLIRFRHSSLQTGPNALPSQMLALSRRLLARAPRSVLALPRCVTAPFSAAADEAPGPRSAEYIALEDKYGAHNYHPIPVVLSRALGAYFLLVLYDCISAC